MKTTITALLLLFTFQAISQWCPEENLRILNWSPSKGGMARMVSQYIDSAQAPTYLITLGQTDSTIIYVTGGYEHDAGDKSWTTLNISNISGETNEYGLFTDRDYWLIENEYSTKTREQIILERMWKFKAEGIYDPNEMEQLLAGRWAHGKLKSSFKITIEDKVTYAWTVSAKPDMCWCDFTWHYSAIPYD